MLNMPKYDEDWHKKDMADELAEYEEASGFIDTWSELSDVAYTYTSGKRGQGQFNLKNCGIIFPCLVKLGLQPPMLSIT